MIWVNGALNANIVAQPIETIANIAGIKVPEGSKFFIVKEQGVGRTSLSVGRSCA